MLGLALLMVGGCEHEETPMRDLGGVRDSLSVMTTYGVSKLVSDSGNMRYRIIAEEWRVYDKTTPPRMYFPKGILLERFDNAYNMNLYITADSAWCYDQNVFKLRGRVVLYDKQKRSRVDTEELYWNIKEQRLYSTMRTHVLEPDRELTGNRFTANIVGEKPIRYRIWQGHGYMPMPEDAKKSGGGSANAPTAAAPPEEPENDIEEQNSEENSDKQTEN